MPVLGYLGLDGLKEAFSSRLGSLLGAILCLGCLGFIFFISSLSQLGGWTRFWVSRCASAVACDCS